MAKYVLAMDQGTTSSRAVLFDEAGKPVAVSQNEFPQIYPKPGWVEHDPMRILASQTRAASDALQKSGVSLSEIAGIGITNQRETTVVWERETGRPIYNAIVWQCRRTAPDCEALAAQGLGAYVTEKTGLLIDAYFSATKIKWILDHVQGARERARRGELLFGTIDTWLIWNFTKGAKHVTDYSNASRTMLYDIDGLRWDERLCGLLEIPTGMLPEVLPSSAFYGEAAKGIPGMEALAGIPIAAAAGDQQAALFGQLCFAPGTAKNTYGTGCFLMMNTGERSLRSKNRLLTTIAWGEGGKIEYALEGSAFNTGSAIKWLRDDLGLIKTSHECDELAETVPDAGGAYFVPAFTGLGAPYWDMYARGTMVGLTRGTGKAHIARAVLESIAFQVKDLAAAMAEDSGCAISDLKADGGASVSDILLQLQADYLDCRVVRAGVTESTALGAAYLAGLKLGVWRDRDGLPRCGDARAFEPKLDASMREQLYAGWRRAVRRALDWENPKD
ncbi:MAG: glycerol kinase GlpK [Bacillota bacterium]